MMKLRDSIENFLREKFKDDTIQVIDYRITSDRFTVRTYNIEKVESELDIMVSKTDTRQQICYEFTKKQFEKFERREKIKNIL